MRNPSTTCAGAQKCSFFVQGSALVCVASAMLLLFLSFSGISFSAPQAQPAPVQTQVKVPETKFMSADRATVEMIKRMARPLSQQELARLKSTRLRPVVDYSPYVTLVRQQVGSSCCIFTAAALVDILKERERPFAPDVSAAFIAYGYQVNIGYYPRDPRINIPADGQVGVVQHLGVCTETSLSSRNFDPANTGTSTHRTPSPAEVPSDNAIREARLLRIWDHNTRNDIKKEDGLHTIKALLANGPVGVLFSDQVYGDHCMALIGYNDVTKQFTFQNSWGEGPDGGFRRWSYDDMLNHLPNICVTIIKNAPTAPDAYPYTARIKLSTPLGRNNLLVKIGVEGQPASTVWGPAPYGAGDGGVALTIDVPLPAYAAQHWPPSNTNQWYLEASYPGQNNGRIEDVVLVRRDVAPPHLYRSSSAHFPISPTTPEKVYIPSRVRNQLTLAPNRRTVPAGQSVLFTGILLTHIAASTSTATYVPVANQQVAIQAVRSDTIEGTIAGGVISKATTDASGKYQVSYIPSSTGRYRAIAVKSDGTTIATSNVVEVNIQ
jgi:hypothetical protein